MKKLAYLDIFLRVCQIYSLVTVFTPALEDNGLEFVTVVKRVCVLSVGLVKVCAKSRANLHSDLDNGTV